MLPRKPHIDSKLLIYMANFLAALAELAERSKNWKKKTEAGISAISFATILPRSEMRASM